MVFIRKIFNRLEDCEAVLKSESEYLPRDLCLNRNTIEKLALINDSYILTLRDNLYTAGHCLLLPTTRKLYLDITQSTRRRSDIRVEDILPVERNESYLYLASIYLKPIYRTSYSKLLLKKYIDIYDEFISDTAIVYSEPMSKDGRKLLDRYLFQEVSDNKMIIPWLDFKRNVYKDYDEYIFKRNRELNL